MGEERSPQSLLTPRAIKFWTSIRIDMDLSVRILLLEKRLLLVSIGCIGPGVVPLPVSGTVSNNFTDYMG
jgi:hypothetical protein